MNTGVETMSKLMYLWVCPKCKNDTLVLSGNDYFTAFWFICKSCGLNSNIDYHIAFGEKGILSFNNAYERLKKDCMRG